MGPPPRNFRNMKCSRSDSRPIIGFGFVNGGFEISSISSFGGLGGPPPRKFRNMNCSRSDSRPILGLLRVSS